MSGYKIGSRYRLVKHPKQPVGKATGYDVFTGEVTIEWEDKTLIPPIQSYPEYYFTDGTLVLMEEIKYDYVGGDAKCWDHLWLKYTGIRETYEYCKRCDMKRYKKNESS